MELQTVKNDWAKKHTHTSFKQGLLSFFSGNINFNKYKDRFRQILVLELSGIVFSDSSSSFSSLLLFLFLLFFLLFSCSPSYLIVHPSLWRPLFPNRLLYFLSFIFSAFFFSFPCEFMHYFSFTDSYMAISDFSQQKRNSIWYIQFFQRLLINHFFLTLKNPLIVTMHS